MCALARAIDPHFEVEPLAEVGDLTPIADPSSGKFGVRVANPLERPLDPWTFLLDK
jgi:hypothetical protein